MEARITAMSQQFKLRQRMEEAQVSHGQTVRADLTNVRVGALVGSADGQTFFCTMGPIRVRRVLSPGDHLPLPTDVRLEGLNVPAPGTYDIVNALVSSNGDIRLVVDDRTWIFPVVRRAAGITV